MMAVAYSDNPILTWIIPVYNGERYIAQAIQSILSQPCKDSSILVIDDGSTDNTWKEIQKITDVRVSALRKENGGVSSARNLGIEKVGSEYIAFLDADDALCRNAYTDEICAILKEKKYDLLSFPYFSADQDMKRANRNDFNMVGEKNGDLEHENPFKHCASFIYRHNILCGDIPIRFPEGIIIREDVVFQFLVYNRVSKMLCIDQNWFIYRNNITSALHRIDCEKWVDNVLPAWYWCKHQCTTESAKNQCDIWLFAEMTDYINQSCMAGEKTDYIKKKIDTVSVRESLENYPILWPSRKEIYEAFLKDEKKYRANMRRKGIVYNFMFRLVRTKFGRKLYFRYKYREDIRAYI